MRSARPRRIGWGFARRAFFRSFLAGAGLLALIGIVAPSQFGLPGRNTLRTGWPLAVLLIVIAAVAGYALLHRDGITAALRRAKEPYVRPLREHEAHEGTVNALDSCPTPFQTRFAAAWLWAPIALAVIGGALAFSSAYFVIDAVLSRFAIGWEQPALALANALSSVVVFRVAAPRFSTWRLAASARNTVSGYFD